MLGQVVHRFVRNPNIASSTSLRVGNRANPFKNTLTILEDPATQRKLFLIGTTNSSTLLANRTQKLIQEEKPDAVFLQTNSQWIETVRHLQNVHTQHEMNQYNSVLRKAIEVKYPNNPKGLIFKFRLYSWLLVANFIKGFPSDFHPFIPSLEMKFALEEAEKIGSKLVLGGLELDPIAIDSLLVEKRMDFPFLFIKSVFALHNRHWKTENMDHYNVLYTQGGEAFGENMDLSRINWFIKLFEKYAPYQKKIFIDQKDIDLFYSLYRLEAKKIVAVVNQWHVPGIEAHWRHTTRTEIEREPINPVADFDINAYMENQTVNDKLREITSKMGKSEPATWSNFVGNYIKEGTEYHRVRHVNFLSYNDDEIYHGLPYGSHGDHGTTEHNHEKPKLVEEKKGKTEEKH